VRIAVFATATMPPPPSANAPNRPLRCRRQAVNFSNRRHR